MEVILEAYVDIRSPIVISIALGFYQLKSSVTHELNTVEFEFYFYGS